MAPVVSLLSRHLPDPEGTAAGQALYALGSGLVEHGVDLDVCTWKPGELETDLPSWARHEPLAEEGWLPMKTRAFVRPRSDVERSGWRPRAEAIAAADDLESWRAVAGCGAPTRVATAHYSPVLDDRVLGSTLATIQWRRTERAVRRQADRVIAYSSRVGRQVAGPGRSCAAPIAHAAPTESLPLIDGETIGMIANWTWAPNVAALDSLMDSWMIIRAARPSAQLHLAGRGSIEGVEGPGVTVFGEVESAHEFLASLTALVFPCPDTSGPKIKVLEAMAAGVPVVTTEAGVEGLAVDSDVAWRAAAEPSSFAAAVLAALDDGGSRAERAMRGRSQVMARHSPRAAAAAWLRCAEGRCGDEGSLSERDAVAPPSDEQRG